VSSPATLDSAISAGLPGARLVAHRPLKGGVSADVTLLDIEEVDGSRRDCVLREHSATHSGHPAELEFALQRSLHAMGLPVAGALAFSSGDRVQEKPWVLIDYIEGSTDIHQAQAQRCIVAMAEQLAAIHEAATDMLPDLPLRTDPQPELLDFLAADARWSGLRAQIAAMGPQPFGSTASLLHGDYWPHNIIWKDAAIAAVIDWEDAAIGDPISDVACAQLELRYAFGIEGAALFVEAYARQRSVDPERLAWWQAYVAASGVSSMANWGLEPERETHMRAIATQFVDEAAQTLSV